MRSNTTTVCCILKPFPLTEGERKRRRAVSAATMRAKLQASGKYKGGEPWSGLHDALLKQLWAAASKERLLAAFPNRTWAAITKRAADQKIRRSRAATNKVRFAHKLDRFFADLRAIREARGITREELATKAGFHYIMFAKWERGECRPGWFNLRTWLDALEYDIAAVPKNPAERSKEGRPWLEEEENILAELLAQGSTIQEAAIALSRITNETEKRALMLGLIESERTRNASGMTKARLNR
jgi:transcriptional regulator with XRE-family HTH domain